MKFGFSWAIVQAHSSLITNKFYLFSTKNIFCTLMNIESSGEKFSIILGKT